MQVGIVVILFFASITVLYTILRRLRAQNRKPKYLPTSFLKQRWYSWSPQTKYGQVVSNERTHNLSRNLSTTNTSYNPTSNDTEETAATAAAAAGIDRNTSVRSVMTLPAYSQSPKETEQVIGREGERAGMDTVVEFPEDPAEEEARREEEMESLYQIRQARRQEIADREQRRQERRQARARGDWVRLEQLTRESRARAAAARLGTTSANGSSTNISAATLLAEHQSRGRDRRVSAVTYASLGRVRHDGTRLRANSDESERGALLGGAAPMGEGEGQGRRRADSGASSLISTLPRPHFRDRSTSSILSVSTTASELENRPAARLTPPPTRDGAASVQEPRSSEGSDPAGTGTSDSSPTVPRFTPEASTGSDDVGESYIPAPTGSEPPRYEQLEWGDAPAYESPVSPINDDDRAASPNLDPPIRQQPATSPTAEQPGSQQSSGLARVPSRAPRLPTFESLPSISVEGATEPNTPASTRGQWDDVHDN
jgi:hypothetical protein